MYISLRERAAGARIAHVHSAAHVLLTRRRLGRHALPPGRPAARGLGRQRAGPAALGGDEVVLDAGCGSGKVTAQLLERLPRGRVIGADLSPAMLAEARSTLARLRRTRDVRPDRPARGRHGSRRAAAGRRHLLDRDLPLDRRPRAPVRRAAPRRQAWPAARRRSSAAAPTWPASCAPRTRSRRDQRTSTTCRASRCGAFTTRRSKPESDSEARGIQRGRRLARALAADLQGCREPGRLRPRRRPAQPPQRAAARAAGRAS